MVLRVIAAQMEHDDPLAAVLLDDLAYRLRWHRGQGRKERARSPEAEGREDGS